MYVCIFFFEPVEGCWAQVEGVFDKCLVQKCQVYALTKERDTLRREQNKRSDAAALLKEKDEIITQVMAEGTTI